MYNLSILYEFFVTTKKLLCKLFKYQRQFVPDRECANAKPLAFELYKKGYKVWDIGHMFKDYDYWCKKKARTEAEIMQFYMPD